MPNCCLTSCGRNSVLCGTFTPWLMPSTAMLSVLLHTTPIEVSMATVTSEPSGTAVLHNFPRMGRGGRVPDSIHHFFTVRDMQALASHDSFRYHTAAQCRAYSSVG